MSTNFSENFQKLYKPNLLQRFINIFDNTLSKGSLWLIFWLIAATTVVVFSFAILFVFFEIFPDNDSVRNISWLILNKVIDPGSMAEEEGSYTYFTFAFVITMFGIIVFSTFIGLITTALEERIHALRRGRNPVIENMHTVIYGWSDKVISIIREFIEANRDNKRSSIVVFGDADKVEMEEKINSEISDTGNTKIICRSGHSGELQAPLITSANTAKSIIIAAPDTEESDIHVIKNLLALVKNPNRRKEPYQIVTEIRDPHNSELAKIVGGDEVRVITGAELISRLLVQTSLQSGLPAVMDELTSFQGNEFHFTKPASHLKLAGRSFQELILSFEQSIIVGIARNNYQEILLKPSFDTLFQEGDHLITIALSKKQSIHNFVTTHAIDQKAIVQPKAIQLKPINTLILGFNWKIKMILQYLDNLAPENSSVTIISRQEMGKEEQQKLQKLCSNNLVKLSIVLGDPANRKVLIREKISQFDSIIVLGEESKAGHPVGDAHTLVTLLHARDLIQKENKDISIVTEMLDVQNKNLAQAARADDFIVSDQMISRIMAQYSETPHIEAVYGELLEAQGVEVKLFPASDYVRLGTPVNFFTVSQSAINKNQIALGVRLANQINQRDQNYGIHLNPTKSKIIDGFSPSDKIIVLAE